MTSGSLWNYFRHEVNNDASENNEVGNYRINNNKTKKGNLLSERQK